MQIADVTYKPASRLLIATSLSLIACALIAVVMRDVGSGQIFEAFGAAKRYGLPVTYVIFTFVVLWPYAGTYPKAQKPLWWYGLLFLLATATAGGLLYVRQPIIIFNLAQSLALIGGLLIISWAGLMASRWTPMQQYKLLTIIGISALLSALLQIPLGPFVSISAPATWGLLYAAIRIKKGRYGFILMSGIVGFSTFSSLLNEANPSISLIMQMAVCVAVFGVALTPKPWRLTLLAAGMTAMLFMFFNSNLPLLMTGEIPPTEDDTTLTHRAYEAATVEQLVLTDSWSSMFGLGPSATVDLSSSPDRRTLFVAGRDVTAVDDVHFLTSWMLLKFGLFGVIWLFVLAIAVLREVMHILIKAHPPVFEVFLMMFVLAGVISALPAATNFFANPLAPLFLGILIARRKLNLCRLTTIPHRVDEAGFLTAIRT